MVLPLARGREEEQKKTSVQKHSRKSRARMRAASELHHRGVPTGPDERKEKRNLDLLATTKKFPNSRVESFASASARNVVPNEE